MFFTFLYDSHIVIVEGDDARGALALARAKHGEPQSIHSCGRRPLVYEMSPEVYLMWEGNWFYDRIVTHLGGESKTISRLN
jgi:hypothetical protein